MNRWWFWCNYCSPLARNQSRRGFFLLLPACKQKWGQVPNIHFKKVMMHDDDDDDDDDSDLLMNLQAAIHCVYCDSDSQRSHRSDMPSAEGTESLIPYLKCWSRWLHIQLEWFGWWNVQYKCLRVIQRIHYYCYLLLNSYLPWWMFTSGATSQPFKLMEKVGSMLKLTESSRLFQLDSCRSLQTK